MSSMHSEHRDTKEKPLHCRASFVGSPRRRDLHVQNACLGIAPLCQTKAAQGTEGYLGWIAFHTDRRENLSSVGVHVMQYSPSPIWVARISDHNSCISSVVGLGRDHHLPSMKVLTLHNKSQPMSHLSWSPTRRRMGGYPSHGSRKNCVHYPFPTWYLSNSMARCRIWRIPLHAQEALCGGRAHQIELPQRYFLCSHFTHKASLFVSISHDRRRMPAWL